MQFKYQLQRRIGGFQMKGKAFAGTEYGGTGPGATVNGTGGTE